MILEFFGKQVTQPDSSRANLGEEDNELDEDSNSSEENFWNINA